MNTWPSFVANLFLVQAWNILPYLTWNGASWFVSVEFLLCLLFPLYLFLSARGGAVRGAILIAVGAVVLSYLAQHVGPRPWTSPSTTASSAAWRASGSAWDCR